MNVRTELLQHWAPCLQQQVLLTLEMKPSERELQRHVPTADQTRTGEAWIKREEANARLCLIHAAALSAWANNRRNAQPQAAPIQPAGVNYVTRSAIECRGLLLYARYRGADSLMYGSQISSSAEMCA